MYFKECNIEEWLVGVRFINIIFCGINFVYVLRKLEFVGLNVCKEMIFCCCTCGFCVFRFVLRDVGLLGFIKV